MALEQSSYRSSIFFMLEPLAHYAYRMGCDNNAARRDCSFPFPYRNAGLRYFRTTRYFPFYTGDESGSKKLRLSMKTKGLLEPARILTHPLETGEYVLIPLLLRCIQIADQLAVSAVVRGIQCPVKRSSYYGKRCGLSTISLPLCGALLQLRLSW